MSALRVGSAGTVAATDPGRATRWFAAVLIPIGPAAVAVLRFILPYDTTDDEATMVARVAADLGAQSQVLWLLFVATLTLVPAALWVGRLTRPRAPRITGAAMILLVPGYLVLPWLGSVDALVWTGAAAGADQDLLARLTTTTHPSIDVAAAVFVLGHVLGTILLGFALWLSRTVPRWAALLTIVSQPLHFVAAVILASPALDLAAWGMQAIAFGAAAVAILRLPGRRFDLY